MPLHDPNWTLEQYIKLALQLSGSAFTVVIAEEERGTIPEPCPAMATMPSGSKTSETGIQCGRPTAGFAQNSGHSKGPSTGRSRDYSPRIIAPCNGDG